MKYLIAGNFQAVQFLQMGDLVTFCGSIFVDAHDCAITSMYKHAYFTGLFFAVHECENLEKWAPRKFPTVRYCSYIVSKISNIILPTYELNAFSICHN